MPLTREIEGKDLCIIRSNCGYNNDGDRYLYDCHPTQQDTMELRKTGYIAINGTAAGTANRFPGEIDGHGEIPADLFSAMFAKV